MAGQGHPHTVESGDAVTTVEQLARRVAETGIDVVCVTEHNHISDYAGELSRLIGARVIIGEEIRTQAGELLGPFLTERVPYVLPAEEVVARTR